MWHWDYELTWPGDIIFTTACIPALCAFRHTTSHAENRVSSGMVSGYSLHSLLCILGKTKIRNNSRKYPNVHIYCLISANGTLYRFNVKCRNVILEMHPTSLSF